MSRGPPIVGLAKSSYPEYLDLSEVSLFAGSSYPEYLELSRGSPSVRSISVSQEHEQLSKVPPVVESTYSCPKYLQLVESDFCQTGSVIESRD